MSATSCRSPPGLMEGGGKETSTTSETWEEKRGKRERLENKRVPRGVERERDKSLKKKKTETDIDVRRDRIVVNRATVLFCYRGHNTTIQQ